MDGGLGGQFWGAVLVSGFGTRFDRRFRGAVFEGGFDGRRFW